MFKYTYPIYSLAPWAGRWGSLSGILCAWRVQKCLIYIQLIRGYFIYIYIWIYIYLPDMPPAGIFASQLTIDVFLSLWLQMKTNRKSKWIKFLYGIWNIYKVRLNYFELFLAEYAKPFNWEHKFVWAVLLSEWYSALQTCHASWQ